MLRAKSSYNLRGQIARHLFLPKSAKMSWPSLTKRAWVMVWIPGTRRDKPVVRALPWFPNWACEPSPEFLHHPPAPLAHDLLSFDHLHVVSLFIMWPAFGWSRHLFLFFPFLIRITFMGACCFHDLLLNSSLNEENGNRLSWCVSHLHFFLWSWTSDITSLHFCILICKIGIIIVSVRFVWKESNHC